MHRNTTLEIAGSNGRKTEPMPSGITVKLERQWFEFDRSAVLRQIDMVQGTIDDNANDLGLVALEGVFEKSLSDGLLKTSRSLHVIANELTTLRSLVAHTNGYPKAEKKRVA